MVGQFLRAWVVSQPDLATRITDPAGKPRLEAWRTGQLVPGFPRLVYFEVEGDTVKTLTGPASLQRSVVQVEAQSDRYAEAQEVAAMLVGNPEAGDQRLDGFQGTLGGVKVEGCHLSSRQDLFDAPLPGTDVWVARVVMDFVIWWKPAA